MGSIQSWRSFGDRQDVRRCLVALPLLGLCIVASNIMAVAPAAPFARMLLNEDNIVWDGGWQSVPILRTFYNLPWLDDMWVFRPCCRAWSACVRLTLTLPDSQASLLPTCSSCHLSMDMMQERESRSFLSSRMGVWCLLSGGWSLFVRGRSLCICGSMFTLAHHGCQTRLTTQLAPPSSP